MADEIDLNDEEEAALEAAWAKLSKKPVPEDEAPTDEFVGEIPDDDTPPKVKPSPFAKE